MTDRYVSASQARALAERLLPCPFCGAGETRTQLNGRMWTGMKWSEPVSVSVHHWCEPVAGQPSRMIERVGRDEESAIAAWNQRPAPPARDGWQMVPKEPTQEMCRSALSLMLTTPATYGNLYRAMLAAAPPADPGAAPGLEKR